MLKTFLRSKIHRATITSADRDYEGSISLCRELCRAAELLEFEQVDVYDIANGAASEISGMSGITSSRLTPL